MNKYIRQTIVQYIVEDEVEADSYAEAEALPITEEVPEGAVLEVPIAILKDNYRKDR
tara:strand:+ start:72 stop:242 length:171 start_codon:yes stop_codon:yes gene_type:complete